IDRYAGPLLDGFVVRAPAFEEWVVAERQRLHERAVEAMYAAARAAADAGSVDSALDLARRLLRLQPWHEQGSLLAIRMLTNLGERGAAMQQYRPLARVLSASSTRVLPSKPKRNIGPSSGSPATGDGRCRVRCSACCRSTQAAEPMTRCLRR